MALRCRAQVVEGEFEGAALHIDYWLEHRDPQAVEIGQRDFAGLRRATGVLAPDDSGELHWRPFKVKIGVQPHKGTGEMENVVKQYLIAPVAEAA